MTLKAYLKQICDYEQDIYERKSKISNLEQAICRVKGEVEGKKKELKKGLDDLTEKYKGKQKDYSRHINAKPEGLQGTIITILIVLIVTVVFHILLRHFIVNVASANEVVQALPTLFIANLLPAIGITFLAYVFLDACSLRSIFIAFVISLIALVILASIYLQLFINSGRTMGAAIIAAMLFFVVVELIVGAIVCYFTDVSHKNNARAHKKSAIMAKKDMQTLAGTIEKHKQQMAAYDNKAKTAIVSMEKDLAKEKQELAVKQDYLKKLYAQNIVHPKYQYWVAVATFYDYLDTGIRDKLEGPFGIYDLYEQELRAQKITNSIEGIRSSMNYQAHVVNDSQRYIKNQLETVISHLGQISVNTYGY